MTDEKGNKIIPTKPLKVTIKAPNGSKPGDKVKVDIPNDIIGTSKKIFQEKLVILIVDMNGNITFTVTPQAFKKLTIILIIIEKITTIPVTGGAGGS